MKSNLFLIIFLNVIIYLAKAESIKEVNENNNIIEIDKNMIITQISWTKTEDYIFNYLLGVFEASNDPSFKEAIPIAIIKEQGEFNEINYIDINTPNTYKYIRYIPPNKNNTKIFPIKIFGYQSESSENLKEEKYFQVTNLPLISIHTENSTDPIKDMDINCIITIIKDGKIETNEKSLIKVRGRSSNFASPKKSFRIKFPSKQKILNFKGKEKRWTLIANHFDRSFLRNALAYKISELMQFKFSPKCQPVDVILNGNYQGNYYICDKIEVGKNRVNVTKIEPTDISEPNITGGYLLEIDASSQFGGQFGPRNQSRPQSGGGNTFKTSKGIVGKIEFPEEDNITPEQKEYIIAKLNQFENEIYNGILDSIDLESYSKFFLVEEFCADPDHVFSSFYFTKERNDDKFYFGPVWDFDLAFDNDKRLSPTSEKPEFSLNYGDSAGTTREFIKTLIGNRNVMEYIKQTWETLCNTVLNEKVLIDFLDEKSEYIKESAELTLAKWDHYNVENERRGWGGGFGRKGEDFTASVEVVKDYVKNRFISLTNLIVKAYSSTN